MKVALAEMMIMVFKNLNFQFSSLDVLGDVRINLSVKSNSCFAVFPNMESSTTAVTHLSNTTNITHGEYGPFPHWKLLFYFYLWKVFAPTVFSFIILVGTLGNLLVVYIITTKSSMQSPINILLVNLALSDIAFLLVCGPLTAYKYASSSWPEMWGSTACSTVQYIMYVTNYVTVYTLVAITAVRYYTLTKFPGGRRCVSTRNATCLIPLIWFNVLVFNVPTALVHTVKRVGVYKYCGIKPDVITAFNVAYFVFAYAFPLSVICVLSLLMLAYLRQTRANSDLDQIQSRTSSASRVIILIIVVFGILWLPFHVQQMVSTFQDLPHGEVYEVFRILWQALTYANSFVNPIIYNYSSKEFRDSFTEVKNKVLRKPTVEREVEVRLNGQVAEMESETSV